MSVKIVRGSEHAPIEPLNGKRVVVVGFGNQGHAHALNLRESGVDVVVANRPDTPTGRRAAAAGFDPQDVAPAVDDADLVIIAAPDEAQPELFKERIAPHLKRNAVVGFLHGFNIRYGFIEPDDHVGVIMVAPKGPGATLRELYLAGRGLPCLLAVHRDAPDGGAEALGLAWANGIGCARAGIVYTTFADETETDLFGEQAVLCGGMSELIRHAFEVLTAAGYPPELAYLECCHEVKQVADLIYQRGLWGAFKAISNTAEYGAYRAGAYLIDASVRTRMEHVLADVRDGTFAASLREDFKNGFPWFEQKRAAARDHALEPVGEVVRGLMPWLKEGDGRSAMGDV